MLSLDLFDSRYERQLREGAVDDLEARRIDDLNMRMLELLDRAKEPAYKKNPDALAGLKREFQKIKAERDSYFKINPATGMNDSGTLGTVKGRLDVDETGIPGNVPTEKIPGKEDLLKGRGRTYYESQKKSSKQVDEHGGGIGPSQRWQDLMPEQSNPEDYDDADEFGMPGSEFFSDDDRLRDGDYVRDRQDGEYGEIFRMSGDPSERRVRILDRDGRGWYISPDRLEPVDRNDPDIMKYFGKRRQRDMDEGWSDAMVARRTGQPRTPYSVYIKGKKWKDFENDDHARAVMDKLKAKFKADGRDPETITIAPTDIPEAKATKTRLDPKCWTGKKIGNPKTKVKGGVRVNNCVPAESINEVKDTEAVEQAILKRIMVSHTDLLMKFGPEKVMQAAEDVAYNVGDVGEIGTSDVSGWVRQVQQILGAVQETTNGAQ